MPSAALLDRATELLRAVMRFDAPADGVVSAYFLKHRMLGQRDRHALAETVYAVLRQRLRLQHLAQSGSGPLERRLAAAAWQGDERTLQAALAPREREWLAAIRAVDPASLPDKLRHNLPPWLAEALQRELGEAEFNALAAALLLPAPLDLRVNTLKTQREAVQQALHAEGIAATPTPYSPWGLRIAGRPAVNRLQLFKSGAFEVQDEGSQLLALLVEPRRGEMVVDFCAGAGGKTLALGATMRSTGRLYAFDTSAHRLDALKPRLARSGLSNVHPVQIAHERDERVKRLAGKIDRVLVDAPCSGLGTLRRNPDLKWRQTPETVAALSRQQAAILAAAARLVKPGGRLVYATCSLLQLENEAIAADFEQAHAGFDALDAAEVLRRHVADAAPLVAAGRMRLWPHRHATDGFFAAIWQRRA
ncbi:MAG: RsmB/NOP family class I SAM-dependent RNA methyltransferase [Burkholderiaceae bacterium]